MAVEFLSVTLFKLLHHGFTRYSGQLGKGDSYCILFDEIKVPNQSINHVSVLNLEVTQNLIFF